MTSVANCGSNANILVSSAENDGCEQLLKEYAAFNCISTQHLNGGSAKTIPSACDPDLCSGYYTYAGVPVGFHSYVSKRYPFHTLMRSGS